MTKGTTGPRGAREGIRSAGVWPKCPQHTHGPLMLQSAVQPRGLRQKVPQDMAGAFVTLW